MKKTGEEPLLSGGNGIVNQSTEEETVSPRARKPEKGERETPADIADQRYRNSERRIEEAWQLDR